MATVVPVGAEYEENLSLRYLVSAVEGVGFRAEIVPFNTSSGLEDAVRLTPAARPVAFASHLRSLGFSGNILR